MSTPELLPRSVWISKFALTEGVALRRATLDEDGNALLEALDHAPGKSIRMFVRACYVHSSFEAAVRRADDLRKKRIASLRRQIARLEALSFSDICAAPDVDAFKLADGADGSPGEIIPGVAVATTLGGEEPC